MSMKSVPLLKPRAVLPGSTLAVISPASYPQIEKVERAISVLEECRLQGETRRTSLIENGAVFRGKF